MDYESNEEDTDDSEEQAEDEEAPSKDDAAEDMEDEPQSASLGARSVKSSKKRRREEKESSSLDDMRINAVLQSIPAIERYSYDHVNELWCEVGPALTL